MSDYNTDKPSKGNFSYKNVAFRSNDQLYMENDQIIDPTPVPDIVDMTPAETKKGVLSFLNANRFDIRQFHTEFEDRTEEVLEALLSLQSNEDPLKKGKENIAFRADIFIRKNRQRFSTNGNDILDVIMGVTSSHPQDKSYYITIKNIADYLGIEDLKSVYEIAKKGVEEIKSKPLEFDIPLGEGKIRKVNVPIYKILTYVDTKQMASASDEEVHISFSPSDFFKMLCISSTITHGAHYNSHVSHRLQGYAKTFYYFLEEMKDYTAYPGAKPGVFEITTGELQDIVGCKYEKSSDQKRYILNPTRDALERLIDIGNDITFSYKEIKKSRRIVGYQINISKIVDGNRIETDRFKIEEGILDAFNYKKKAEILKTYQENNRDVAFLTQAVSVIAGKSDISNKESYLIMVLKNGLNQIENRPKKSGFHNASERNNDYEELETLALKKSSKS